MIITGGYKKCDINEYSTSIIAHYKTIKDIPAQLCRFKKQKREFDSYKNYNKGLNTHSLYLVYKNFHFYPEYRKSLFDMSKANRRTLEDYCKNEELVTMENISISYEDIITEF